MTAKLRAAQRNKAHMDPNTLRGSQFTFEIQENVTGEIADYTFAWHSNKTKGCYPKRHVEWVAWNIVCKLGDGGCLVGCTQHIRKGQVFRAHPSYRGSDCWHNWELFEWHHPITGAFNAPGQIIMFLSFPNRPVPIEFDNGRFCVDKAGLYCLVQCLDDPFGPLTINNIIAEARTKTVGVNVPGWGERQRLTGKCLYLVSVDCIHGPMTAVPHVGGDPEEFILVRPFDTWGEGFTSYLNGGL
jgi:hypothetical protein